MNNSNNSRVVYNMRWTHYLLPIVVDLIAVDAVVAEHDLQFLLVKHFEQKAYPHLEQPCCK